MRSPARKDIFVETFVLSDDKIGHAFQQALIAAGQRGIRVGLTVDGHGSAD